MNRPILGVLGGLGPAASVYFYDLITSHTAANKDSDHIDLVLASAASTPDRTDFIVGDGEDPLPSMIETAKRLAAFGADFIALPCNTAHYFYEKLTAATERPVINIIRETVDYLRSQGITRMGLLATDGTVTSGAYEKVCFDAGIECITPDESARKKIMSIIYDDIKAGKSPDMEAFHGVSASLLSHGAQKIVLGCTELSLIKRDEHLPDSVYVDSLEVLACRCITLCGKKPIGFCRSLITFEGERDALFGAVN